MKQNQTEQIIDFLKSGRSITPIDALNHIGCFRLASRISEIKKLGFNIQKDMVTDEISGKTYARYRLD